MNRPFDPRNPPSEQELREHQRKFDDMNIFALLREAIRTRHTVESICVQYSYRQRFGRKVVHFDMNSNESGIFDHPDHISVSTSAICIMYLKFFNKSISKVLIVYAGTDANSTNNYLQINRAISEYCADNLKSIAFKCAYAMPITLQGLQGTTFHRLETIRLINVNLDVQLPVLANQFRNIYRLELNEVSMHDSDVRFQFLRDLDITYASERTCTRLIEVSRLLRLNSMLQNLRIEMPNVDDMSMEFLLDILDENTSFKVLIVKTGLVNEPVTEEQINRLMKFYQVKVLDLGSFRMTRTYANFLWRNIWSLSTFVTRIVKYEIPTPMNEDQLLTRFVRNDRGYEVVAPILRIRTMPRDDPVTFRRSSF